MTSINMVAKIRTNQGGGRPAPIIEVRVKASVASLGLAKGTRRGVMTYVSLNVRKLPRISSGKVELWVEPSVFPRALLVKFLVLKVPVAQVDRAVVS